MDRFREKFSDLFDFSLDRLQKVIEIGQYAAIYFLLGLFFGLLSERIFQKETRDTATQRSTIGLLLLTITQMAFDVIMIYYIHKIASLVPFAFKVTPNYISNFKGEAVAGGAVALAVTFSSIHPSLAARITELANRWGCDLC
jgi:nitrate reductase gamma subunit